MSSDEFEHGHWNWRVLKHEVSDLRGGTETEFYVGEVYYDENSNPIGWTGPVAALGETVEELKDELNLMLKALDQPVIDSTQKVVDSGA